jgi:hypothetical protein
MRRRKDKKEGRDAMQESDDSESGAQLGGQGQLQKRNRFWESSDSADGKVQFGMGADSNQESSGSVQEAEGVGRWKRKDIAKMEQQVRLNAQLLDAAADGDAGKVAEALGAGADKDARDSKCMRMAALHLAAMQGHVEVLQMLIKAGAKLERRDDRGMSPLHVAVLSMQTAAARVLVQAGARIHSKQPILNIGPLCDGEEGGGEHANVGQAVARVRTPLDWAQVFGSRDMLDALRGAQDELGEEESGGRGLVEKEGKESGGAGGGGWSDGDETTHESEVFKRCTSLSLCMHACVRAPRACFVREI